MNFVDLNRENNQGNLIPVQTKRNFYGLRTKDYSIIKLRIPIEKG